MGGRTLACLPACVQLSICSADCVLCLCWTMQLQCQTSGPYQACSQDWASESIYDVCHYSEVGLDYSFSIASSLVTWCRLRFLTWAFGVWWCRWRLTAARTSTMATPSVSTLPRSLLMPRAASIHRKSWSRGHTHRVSCLLFAADAYYNRVLPIIEQRVRARNVAPCSPVGSHC